MFNVFLKRCSTTSDTLFRIFGINMQILGYMKLCPNIKQLRSLKMDLGLEDVNGN